MGKKKSLAQSNEQYNLNFKWVLCTTCLGGSLG